MSMLEGRDWYFQPGASPEALDRLRDAAPVALPDSYYALLAETNGGEGPIPVQPFNVCLDPAETAVEALATGNHGQSDLDGFVVFGGNGGGELLAFDVRGSLPLPIVSVDMVAGVESAEQVAGSFDEFVDMLGQSAD